ncbi:MAG: hypothetical protein ABL962_20160, partial [Fimbriimonadaceae bacterium]
MKPKLLLLTLIALVSAIGVSQPENRQLRRSVENFYASMDKHASRGHFGEIIARLDKNYVCTDVQGHRMNRAEMAASMRDMSKMRDMRSKTTVRHVNGNSNEAFSWVEMKMTYKEMHRGRWVQMSKTHRLSQT